MSDSQNYKGELQTFCVRHLFSAPKYKSEQIQQTAQWKSECIVTISKQLLGSVDKEQFEIYKTTETKQKKKESEAEAAKKMLYKLKDETILSPDVLLNIKHAKHLKKLSKNKTNKLEYTLEILELLFSDEQISNSIFMQKLIESSNNKWISLDHLLTMSTFQDAFGEFGWNMDQYQKSKDLLINIIQTKSKILELSENKLYVRKKELFENIESKKDQKDQIKSESLRKCGNQLFKQNKYNQALNKYLEALKYDKIDHKILMNLSLVYLKLNDFENALIFAKKGITSRPSLSKPYARAAMVFYKMGKVNQAIATLNNAIVLQPKNEQYKQLHSEWTKTIY